MEKLELPDQATRHCNKKPSPHTCDKSDQRNRDDDDLSGGDENKTLSMSAGGEPGVKLHLISSGADEDLADHADEEGADCECAKQRLHDFDAGDGPHVEYSTPSQQRSKSSLHKYRHAMYHFLPVRREMHKSQECPYETAGFFSTITFHWIQSLMWKIYRHGLKDNGLWPCPQRQNAETSSKRLERLWKEELLKKTPETVSFGSVLFRFVRTRILAASVALAIHVLISFVGPAVFLRAILEYTQADRVDVWYGVGLAFGLSFMELARSLSSAVSFSMNYQTGIQLRGAVLTLVYQKVLRLRSLKDKTAGQLVNLFSSDAHRLFEASISGYNIISGPLISVVALVYLLFLIGPMVVVGFTVILCFYPFQLAMSKLTSLYRRKAVVITDKRVRLMNEILTCVKLIKMYAWEKPFAKTIAGIRQAERKMLEKSTYVHSMTMAFTPGLPTTAAILTVVAHTLMGNDLTAAQAFTLLSVFNCVRPKLSVAPGSLKSIIESRIAAKRYQEILTMEEAVPKKWSSSGFDILFENATLAWDAQPYDREELKPPSSPVKTKRFHSESEDFPLSSPHSETPPVPKSSKPTSCHCWPRISDPSKNPEVEADSVSVEERDPEFEDALLNISLKVKKGQLVGICGCVGCGKSSLLAAVLGQMKLMHGKVEVGGSLAYVAQQAWIINATVRENIIFGKEWDSERYQKVIEACKLLPDFERFPNGDETEIGERGINLSGGQKQRVSLARAVYSDRDILLLDDPLSAVDSRVGSYIFHQCILSLLKNKTVLFVTHQLQYLNECDLVVYLGDGRVIESGEHLKLMKQDGEYAALVNHYHSEDKLAGTDRLDTISHAKSMDELSLRNACENVIAGESDAISHSYSDPHLTVPSSDAKWISSLASVASVLSVDSAEGDATGKLVAAESRARGNIGWRTYISYIEAAGGWIVCVFVLLIFFINIACSGLGNMWLAYWLKQGSGNTTIADGNVSYISDKISDNPRMWFYNTVLGAILVAILLATCIRSFLLMKSCLHASCSLHDQVFVKVLRSPMSFFDATPSGRILNRFSKDLDDIDVGVPMVTESFLQNVFLVVLCVFMIVYVFPWFLAAVLPIIVVFYFLQKIFRVGLRELKRLDHVTRSPLFSFITASVQGLQTIKAYDKYEEYSNRFKDLLDRNSMPVFLHHCAKRWLTVRLDLIAIFIILTTAVLIVLLKNTIPTAYAGLALSYAVMLIGLFQYTLRMALDTETQFTAVERIEEYIKCLDSEAPAILKESRPPSTWPMYGNVKFEKVRMKYRPGLPNVLRGITFDIMPEEKIGIIGRTGSGKSSLGIVLFRMVEISSGFIEIDGVNIRDIGLEDLRSRLSIIPQDPVLFVGSIRYNLDPFDEHSDADIWSALKKCHVTDMIRALPGRLDSTVVENGENFSVGERQLLCLARALLRKSKILMLDEATASIDSETDSLIQQTIAESFSRCTILTIAHRLNTVLNYDRIMVLKNGKVAEFGKPATLLSNPSSIFSAMMSAVDNHRQGSLFRRIVPDR